MQSVHCKIYLNSIAQILQSIIMLCLWFLWEQQLSTTTVLIDSWGLNAHHYLFVVLLQTEIETS